MPVKPDDQLARLLRQKTATYNKADFIADDPIVVPHSYSLPQDQEIAGFFAAIFAWGNRTTIISKTRELMRLMDDAPHQFVTQHQPADLKPMLSFRHRTFQADDVLYFLHLLQWHYTQYPSLETAFSQWMQPNDLTTERALIGFRHYFFSQEHLPRTRKHISTPEAGSACKRLNMYLRWMVRHDNHGVDFGLWRSISPAQLVCPLDVHVARVARRLGLLQRKQNDWAAALELTAALRQLDAQDPVQFDFALFALGVMEQY